MNTTHLNAIIQQVSGYNVKQTIDYDYNSIRKRQIFEALTEGVFYVHNNALPGDIAEFGTASGFSGFTIARAMYMFRHMYVNTLKQAGRGDYNLHFFDSFEGLPVSTLSPDTNSPYVQSGRWAEGTFKGLSAEELKALCVTTYDADKIFVHPGWYRDTLTRIAPTTKFAMLHLDCDLYSSTHEVLDHLFAHNMVADGCILFLDDWNCNHSSPKFGMRKAWKELVNKHNVEFSDGGDYAIVSHKFIIHRD